MILDGNIFTEVGDSLILTSSPVTGYFSFYDFEAQSEDETSDRYFDYFFCYAKDGIHFTDFIALNSTNLSLIANNINYKDSLIFKFSITRAGSDIDDTITFNNILLRGNYIDIEDIQEYEKSILYYFKRQSIDFEIETWAINVLQKVYEKGLIPNYLTRNKNSNYEEDRDFIKYWKTIAQFLAIYVVLARDFSKFYKNEKLLLEFLKQRGLYFCDDEADYYSLSLLMNNYYDEIKKRGTIQIIRRGTIESYFADNSNSLSDSSSNSSSNSQSSSDSCSDPVFFDGINDNRNLNGEFLRLLCWHACDEFIFNLRRPEKFGWNLRNTSPLYRGNSNMLGFNKCYEDTIDVLDLCKYPRINDPYLRIDNDISVMQLKAMVGGGKVGIGIDTSQNFSNIYGSELVENGGFLNPAMLLVASRWMIAPGQNAVQFQFTTGDSVIFYWSFAGSFGKFLRLINIPVITPNMPAGVYEVQIEIKSNLNLNTKARVALGSEYSAYVSEIKLHTLIVETTAFSNVISLHVEIDPLSGFGDSEAIEISLVSVKQLLESVADYNKATIQKYGIVIDQNIDYEITFFAKMNQEAISDGGFYFGALIFTCENNILQLRNAETLDPENYFLENYSFAQVGKYYFVRGIVFAKNKFGNYNTNTIYKKDVIVRETGIFYRSKRKVGINKLPSLNPDYWQIVPMSEIQRVFDTNLNYGNNLVQAIGTTKIIPLIYVKHLSPDPLARINIYDIKIKPVATDYSTGFIQSDRWLDIFAKNRNLNYSNKQIDEILRKFLLPYDVEFKTTNLEVDDAVADAFDPNAFDPDPDTCPQPYFTISHIDDLPDPDVYDFVILRYQDFLRFEVSLYKYDFDTLSWTVISVSGEFDDDNLIAEITYNIPSPWVLTINGIDQLTGSGTFTFVNPATSESTPIETLDITFTNDVCNYVMPQIVHPEDRWVWTGFTSEMLNIGRVRTENPILNLLSADPIAASELLQNTFYPLGTAYGDAGLIGFGYFMYVIATIPPPSTWTWRNASSPGTPHVITWSNTQKNPKPKCYRIIVDDGSDPNTMEFTRFGGLLIQDSYLLTDSGEFDDFKIDMRALNGQQADAEVSVNGTELTLILRNIYYDWGGVSILTDNSGEQGYVWEEITC